MSQGIFRDPQWDANWTECQSLHFPLGAYPYFDTTSPWKAQANFFLGLLETYSVHPHIIPAIDLEMVRPVPKVADILNFLGDIIAALDVMPIIYTSPSFIMAYLQLPDFGQFPLWISHYSTDRRSPLSAPRVPLPWFPLDIWAWQFSADGNGQGKYYGAESPAIDLYVAWSIPWMPGAQP